MKKRLLCVYLLCASLTLLTSCGSNKKSVSVNKSASDSTPSPAEVTESPYPGHPEMDFIEYNHKIYEEMLDEGILIYDAYEKNVIEDSVLNECTTKELLELVLTCPFSSEIDMFNTKDDAWNSLCEKTNYYSMFEERPDAFITVINYYAEYKVPEECYFKKYNEPSNNTLDRSENIQVHMDMEVKASVTIMEYLIDKFRKANPDNEYTELINNAYAHMYDEETKSELFDYGNSLSESIARYKENNE